MKYVSYIFEDQDVCNTVAQNEYLVEIASNAVIHHNALLESYIYNNLESFLGENLAEVYENIRSFIIKENLAIYSQFSEILSDSQLSDQEKVACFENEVKTATEAVGKSFLKNIWDGVKNVPSDFVRGFNRAGAYKDIAKAKKKLDNVVAGAKSRGVTPEMFKELTKNERLAYINARNARKGFGVLDTNSAKIGAHARDHGLKYAGGLGLASAGKYGYDEYKEHEPEVNQSIKRYLKRNN